MSWAVTVDDLDRVTLLPNEVLDLAGKDNPAYRDDAITAFRAAKRAGLVSATLSGGRTPSPYGGADTVVISIVGFDSRAIGHAVAPQEFNQEMRRTILHGPDGEEEIGLMPPTQGWVQVE